MVDDHEENLRVLAGILGPQGYDLMPAATGLQVFERLAGRVPDLILLDVVLPDIDGLEVCRRLKANPEWSDIPVIFLSAADDKAVVVGALESGGVDYISKPFNQSELLTRVRTHLALKRTRDDLALLAADKDELLKVMAHDFKNQLSGVLMSAKLLLDREECASLPERSLKLLRNVGESSERMMGFLKSFLANQGARQQILKVRKVDLEEMIDICVREVEPIAAVKGTRISREMGNG
ncbi:MAG: response regulator, partial [Armatimonadetes bacterium]|nr:response regulator [Akkermansiaceae bacterium]